MHHRLDHNGEPRETPQNPRRPTERVLVVARHRVFAEALVSALRREGLPAAYSPPDAAESADQARELRPTVLVLVVGSDRLSLLESVASVRDHSPSVRILLLTRDRPDADHFLGAFPSLTSVLTLHVSLRDLIQVIKGARSVSGVADRRSLRRPLRYSAEMSLVDRLTEREREVLGELMAGTSGEQIAANLRISPNTVRTHVQNILAKLGARTRLEAAAVGRQAGLPPARGRRRQTEAAESTL